jgi:hypothetical protein
VQLKKAGFVVACATAGTLALSPLASASVPAGPAGSDSPASASVLSKKHHDDDDDDKGDDNRVKIASGNAVQAGNVQDGVCNTNVGNDAGNLLSPHKNKVNQKKSCNPKNKVKGH